MSVNYKKNNTRIFLIGHAVKIVTLNEIPRINFVAKLISVMDELVVFYD